jgi:arylsulfatase A-like enzyme
MLPTLLGHGEQAPHTYIYHEFIRGNTKPYSARSLRMGDWKAVQTKGKKGAFGPIELYNLKEDLGETKDLAKQFPEIVIEMERTMDAAHEPLKGASENLP